MKRLAAILVTLCCGAALAAGTGYSVYRNTKYKVDFKYPKGWMVTEAQATDEKATFDRSGNVLKYDITARGGKPGGGATALASAQALFISKDGLGNPSIIFTVNDGIRRTEAEMVGEFVYNPYEQGKGLRREDVQVLRKQGMIVLSPKSRQVKTAYHAGPIYVAQVSCFLAGNRRVRLLLMDSKPLGTDLLDTVLGSLTVNGAPVLAAQAAARGTK